MAQSTKTLRMIAEDEDFSPKVEFLPQKKVHVNFSIRRTSKDPRYEKSCILDFSECTEHEVLGLAVASAKVRIQSLLRALPADRMLLADSLSGISVKRDLLEQAPKGPKDPDSMAIRSLMKTGLSEEVAREMLSSAKQKVEANKAGPKVQKGKAA